LHIHNAAAGVSGAIVIPTDVNGTDKTIAVDATGKIRIQKQVQVPQTTPAATLATLIDMIANPQNYYVNIHTTVSPGGAMRGQLVPAELKIVMGLMSPQNEVPPTTSNGSAVATGNGIESEGFVWQPALRRCHFLMRYIRGWMRLLLGQFSPVSTFIMVWRVLTAPSSLTAG